MARGCVFALNQSALPDDLLKEAVPGNIRRAEHFVAFLKRFVEYLKVKSYCHIYSGIRLTLCLETRMKVLHVISETPPSFLQHLKELTFIERKPLRYSILQSEAIDTTEPRLDFARNVLLRWSERLN